MEKTRHQRGRKDIAGRARAVFWYYAVRHLSGLSDEALDRKFVMMGSDGYERGIGRPHAFRRIRVFGADPGYRETRRAAEGLDDRPIRDFRLVDVVAREPGLEHTRAVYESPFWRLITPPAPTLDEIQRIIANLLDAAGLYRATDQDILLGKTFLKDTSPFVTGTKCEKRYATGLMDIGHRGELDDLALLGALAREAAASYGTYQMERISMEFEFCLQQVKYRYELDTEIQKLIGWLAGYRIFSNRWDPIPTKETRQLARRYLDSVRKEQGLKPLKHNSFAIDALAVRYHKRSGVHLHPIVEQTTEIKRLIRNRVNWQKKLDRQRAKRLPPPCDPLFPLADDIADFEAQVEALNAKPT